MGALEFFCAECPSTKQGIGDPNECFEVRLVEMNGAMHLEMRPTRGEGRRDGGGQRHIAELSMAKATELQTGLEDMISRCTPPR